MPSLYRQRHEDIPDGVFHVVNRGVERRPLFLDHHDYQRFKAQLKQALEREPEISLWAYCLMPNHFHLLLNQAQSGALASFMRRLSVSYAMYFNLRYNRVGALFQGRYRANRIVGAQQLMEVARYIHLNPERAHLGWRQHQHSSKLAYIEPGTPHLAAPEPVLELFDVPDDFRRYLSKPRIRS